MNTKLRCHIAASSAIAALFVCAQTSQGSITGIISSDVEGFFGTTSDAFQQSEGPITPTWAPVGFALPYGPAGLPLPQLYAGFPTPNYPTNPPIVPNIPFPAPAGHAPGSPFTDTMTYADYHIYGGYGGAGTYTRNAYVRLGNNTGNLMYLSQPTTATGYAYEEAEFEIDYSVSSTGLLGGATLGTRPYLVYGSFLPGGSAEFGAEVDYWWLTTIPGTTVVTAVTSLGSLQYDDYISNVTGPFVNLVPDTYGSNYLLPSLTGQTGILELTGDVFVIGDPVDINVMAVPEPGSLALLAMGGLGLMFKRSRQVKYKRENESDVYQI
ncbi:MAG TPA: PEP-CTERM sorting domain-containing protein [Phycisphaerae bacterium]|nr:PEP-CTERM sorting domain-containing protein [Phycisphaerae bacterium]